MQKLIFSIPAKKDISSITSYILQFNEQAADDTHRAIFSAAKKIAQFPHMGQSRPEFGNGLFSFPSGIYLIFYTLTDEAVTIVRVLDGRRDIPALFAEDGD